MREAEEEDESDDDKPIRKNKKSKLPLLIVGGIVAVLLLSCVGVGIAGLFALRTTVKKLDEATTVTYTTVNLDKLIDEWKTNPSAATDKYRKNGVDFTGTLQEIGSNLNHETYMVVRSDKAETGLGWSERIAHVFVEPHANDGLKRCIVGKKIRVKARSSGNVETRPWLTADEISPAE